jgi:hypothetical protein
MGCPPEDDLEPTKFDLAMDALKDLGYSGSDILQPTVGTFEGHATTTGNVAMVWSGQTTGSFAAYKEAWNAKYKVARALLANDDDNADFLDNLGDLKVAITFTETAQKLTSPAIDVPAGGILLKVFE